MSSWNTEVVNRPTVCPKCKPFFTPLMQAEARMVGVKYGFSAARSFIDERLEDIHIDHEEDPE